MARGAHGKPVRACFSVQLMRREAREARSVGAAFRAQQSAPLEGRLVLGSHREGIIDQMKGLWREASRLLGN